MKWYAMLANVLVALVACIPVFVRQMEEEMPGDGRGAEKLAKVLGLLQKMADALLIGLPLAWSTIEPIVKPLISKWVEIFNEIGVFVKGDAGSKPERG